jgi:DNA mismatch repair protein MSH4
MSPVARYYALSAASAVFKYVEIRLNTQFTSGSLRIRFVPVEGTMMIDPETVRNLEIVDNTGNVRSPHSLFGYEFLSPTEGVLISFFPLSVLNHCSTAMARRLLRGTLLAPVTGKLYHQSQTTISDFLPVGAALEARLDVVGGNLTLSIRLDSIQISLQS